MTVNPPLADALTGFHPAVVNWFNHTFPAATGAQARAWPLIRARRSTLVAAPTGSGKTLTAFLAAIDELVRDGLAHGAALPDQTSVVYVSPLKALSNDIRVNLQEPLAGIAGELAQLGLPPLDIRTAVRTGDTTQQERAAVRKRAPHILVTTPESLYVLLSSDSGRAMLSTMRTVIVDEIHAVAGSKRGAHLALSLERLDALCAERPLRIGLSATQKPIELVAKFLVGAKRRLRDRRRRARPRARPGARTAADAARSGHVERGVGARLRPARRTRRAASHDAGVRQHATHGRARRAPSDRPARQGRGRGASRQPRAASFGSTPSSASNAASCAC